MQDTYHAHISAKHDLLDLKLREVFRYRNLIWLFTKRSLTVSYKQTILGPLWLFINPILTSIVQLVVFGNIAQLSTEGVPQFLFYLTGNTIWNYFSSCVTTNASTFVNNSQLFGKVYFPRLTVPISNVLSAVILFGIQMLLVVLLVVFYMIRGMLSPNWWAWLLLPVILAVLGIMGMAFGIIISSVTTKYRDLSVLVGFGMQLWMYATAVVYPLSSIGQGWLRNVLLANPVTACVELFRYAILGAGTLMPGHLAISAGVTLVAALAGIVIFNRTERTFMDTV